MLSKLSSNKTNFFAFFSLVWLIVQLASNNLLVSFDEACKTPDAFSYIESAKLLLNGSYPWFRAVGYPLLIAPFIFLFGENGTIVFFTIIHFFCWLISIRLIFKTLLIWNTSKNLSMIGAILYAFSLSILLTTNHLLTETIYNLLLIISLYLLGHWLKNRNYKYTGLIFLVLVLSALIRPLGLHFFYASSIIFILGLIRGNYKLIPYFIISILMLIGHIAMMNKHHKTSQLCLSKNYALYHYLLMEVENYPDINPAKYEKPFFEKSQLLDDSIRDKSYFYSYRDSIYRHRTMAMFTSKKYATLKTMYINFKDELLEGYSNHNQAHNWVYQISGIQHFFAICIIPFLLGLLLFGYFKNGFKKSLLIWLFVCMGIIGYICLGSSLVFWYGDRLHLPFYSLIIYILMIGINNLNTNKVKLN